MTPSRDWVERTFMLCPRVDWGTQGALPLDPAKGFSTLWTPFRAIELSATAYNVRVLIEGTSCRTVYAHDWSFLHGFVTQS